MEITKEQAALILGMTRPAIYYRQDRGLMPDPITVDDMLQEAERLEKEASMIRTRLAMFLQVNVEQ